MIERTFRGVYPEPTITAPLSDMLDALRDNRDETLRLAYFDQSARTEAGKRAEFVLTTAEERK